MRNLFFKLTTTTTKTATQQQQQQETTNLRPRTDKRVQPFYSTHFNIVELNTLGTFGYPGHHVEFNMLGAFGHPVE